MRDAPLSASCFGASLLCWTNTAQKSCATSSCRSKPLRRAHP